MKLADVINDAKVTRKLINSWRPWTYNLAGLSEYIRDNLHLQQNQPITYSRYRRMRDDNFSDDFLYYTVSYRKPLSPEQRSTLVRAIEDYDLIVDALLNIELPQEFRYKYAKGLDNEGMLRVARYARDLNSQQRYDLILRAIDDALKDRITLADTIVQAPSLSLEQRYQLALNSGVGDKIGVLSTIPFSAEQRMELFRNSHIDDPVKIATHAPGLTADQRYSLLQNIDDKDKILAARTVPDLTKEQRIQLLVSTIEDVLENPLQFTP